MKKKPTASDAITVEELLKPENSLQKRHLSQIREVPIELIDDFQEHPFQVKIDEDMDRLVESVRTNGIITPVTLREKPNGRYEVISGHRRKKACEIAGLSTVKAEIRTLDRDEAVILMVDSNLQRSVIMPSEKAWSYKMRLDAMNRQGQRKSTSAPVEQKYSREILADQTGESQAQIYRYVRLTKLLPELLTMVDQRRIAFRPAVELSYLTEKEQRDLLEAIVNVGATPSLAQSIKMKELARSGCLTLDAILSVMDQQRPNQQEKISFRTDRLKPYLPRMLSVKQQQEYILKALECYKQFLDHKRSQSR